MATGLNVQSGTQVTVLSKHRGYGVASAAPWSEAAG